MRNDATTHGSPNHGICLAAAMSSVKSASLAGVKRKRKSGEPERRATKPKSRPQPASDEDEDPQEEILRLEAQITESRKHYNNIATLLKLAKAPEPENEGAVLAAVALCRVFTRLLSTGDMVKNKRMIEAETMIVTWLKQRYQEYIEVLLSDFLGSEHPPKQSVALTLLLRLVKEESKAQKDFNIKNSPLNRTVEALLLLPEEDGSRAEFAEKFFGTYDDIRYSTFRSIKSLLQSELDDVEKERVARNSLSLLLSLEAVPSSKDDIQNLYTEVQGKNPVPSLSSYKSQAQEAWLTTLRSGITKEQRKSVLGVFSHQIASTLR